MNTITLSIDTKRLIGIFILFLLIIFSTAQVVHAAATYPCSKCAPGFAFTKATYKSSTANCNTPVADITYGCDCACGSTSATQQSFGNCRAQCANVPTVPPATPTPNPNSATYPCASKCSANYDYTKASSYTSTTANCASPVAGTVSYSCDCSCGATSSLHQTYADCTQKCSPGGTPTPTPVTICETERCGSTGCIVRCCTTTRVGTSSSTNCVSKIGPTPTPTPPGGPSPTISLTGTLSGTPIPATTSSPTCSCVADSCSPSCTFDTFADIAYSKPLKCSLAGSVHYATPDTQTKNTACTVAKRTKGDADGNGTVNMLDYMYYISASFGGKVPANVNPDFSGDGVVGASDRSIIIKSLPTL